MNTPTAILAGTLGGGFEVAATFLIARAMDLRGAEKGIYARYRSTDLGPAAPSPAAGPQETAEALPEPARASLSGLTSRPVAAFLGVDRRTVQHWADSGLLEAHKDSHGRRIYDEASVRERKAALNGGQSA